jgi:hypothetical protein
MKTQMICVLVCLLILSCSPATTTEITGSWKNNEITTTPTMSTILVTALTSRTDARRKLEEDMASALSRAGYRTVKSLDIMPPFTGGTTPTKDELFSRITESDADAILTVALIDEETETRYVPGDAAYAPVPRFGYYRSFWGYYNTWSPTLYSPGYYEEEKTYFIETNLYDASTEQLLWSGQSETYNPGSLEMFSREFSKVVVSKMGDDGLLNDQSEFAKENDR